MLDLIIAPLASAVLIVIFKLFERFNINIFQAIVFNYLTAMLCGVLSVPELEQAKTLTSQDWFPAAIGLGCLFILTFNLIGISSQKAGVGVTAIANKMSLIIPFVAAIYLFNEQISALNLLGIGIALPGVYLSTLSQGTNQTESKKSYLSWLLPLLIFITSGIIDTTMTYAEKNWLTRDEYPLYSASLFGLAFCIGLTILIVQLVRGRQKLAVRNLFGGIVLGITNYMSIYFLLAALNYPHFEKSTTIAVLNISVVLLSTLLGILFFKEKINWKNTVGVTCCILAILLIFS